MGRDRSSTCSLHDTHGRPSEASLQARGRPTVPSASQPKVKEEEAQANGVKPRRRTSTLW
ncbi:unnamed protein product, partial [Ectocarpus sp. 12 AP-2014]